MRKTLDLKGMACPIPVLRANKEIRRLNAGDEVECWVTDPAAPADFRNFCDSTGHVLVAETDAGDHTVLVVRKGG